MKHLFALFAVVLGAGLGGSPALAQSTNAAPFGSTPPFWVLPQHPGPGISRAIIILTNRPTLGPYAEFLSTNSLNASLTLPKPGVYRTEPYASIVIVPRQHLDDNCIIGSTNAFAGLALQPDIKMPIIRPELRLIPLDQKQK